MTMGMCEPQPTQACLAVGRQMVLDNGPGAFQVVHRDGSWDVEVGSGEGKTHSKRCKRFSCTSRIGCGDSWGGGFFVLLVWEFVCLDGGLLSAPPCSPRCKAGGRDVQVRASASDRGGGAALSDVMTSEFAD